MTTATEILRAEHATFGPDIEAIGRAADAVGRLDAAEVERLVDTAYAFLIEQLVPHAVAEDRVLYPAIERILGAPGSSATMRRDHVELGRLVDRLAALRPWHVGPFDDLERQSELRGVLYSLHAVIRLHLAKEEELYLPMLDERADEPWVQALFETMHAVADAERSVRRHD